MPKIPKTFCIAPWTQIVLRTSGKLGPCCAFSSPLSIKDYTIKEFFNSAWTNSIRKQMLAGEEVNGCTSCYQDEKNFGSSIRTKTNSLANLDDFDAIQSNTYPKELELQISNICNLKCLTCRPEDSSAFLTEDKAIGISDFSADQFILDDSIVAQIFTELSKEKVNVIDLRGGESMLVPNIKHLLNKLTQSNELELKIQTNGTTFDQEWHDLLSKFRSVNVVLSIDAYSEDNNYIRFPADWTSIVNTIDKLRTIANLRSSVNCTVSNLNLPVLPKFLDWLIKEEIECGFSPVRFPRYFELSVLPTSVLEQTLTELKSYQNRFVHAYTNSQFNNIVFYLEALVSKHELDITHWKKFCKTITIRDAYRKNNIFDLQPKLKEYWDA